MRGLSAGVAFFQRSYGAVFSVGYGYEPHPASTRFAKDAVAGYPIDYRAKVEAHRKHPQRPLSPASLAQLALGWSERALDGDRLALRELERCCEQLRARGETDGAVIRWPYTIALRKYGIEPPWCSAMAQAQAASAFTRAYRATGTSEYAQLAARAIQPLLEPHDSELVNWVDEGPILEEVGGSSPPSHVLNGWIFALWGLRDVALAFDRDDARQRFELSVECLLRKLPEYDVGWWTKYSLFPHRIPDLAKPFYHRLHTTQMEIMFVLTDRAEFRAAATRWREYDRRWRPAAAVASKTAFLPLNRLNPRRAAAGDTVNGCKP
jgi:heparosan-N-sulfate-glucuronate 5-epimerase